jgi:hypothetical protein
MRTKIAFGALAVAVGFAAIPVSAQTGAQSQPGMAPMMGQSGQQTPGRSMCSCCQNMAMMQQPQGQQAPQSPRPQ